jgi:hypothetical protein
MPPTVVCVAGVSDGPCTPEMSENAALRKYLGLYSCNPYSLRHLPHICLSRALLLLRKEECSLSLAILHVSTRKPHALPVCNTPQE